MILWYRSFLIHPLRRVVPVWDSDNGDVLDLDKLQRLQKCYISFNQDCIVSSELVTRSGDKLGSAHFAAREDNPERWFCPLMGTQQARSGLLPSWFLLCTGCFLCSLLLPHFPLPRRPSFSELFVLAAGNMGLSRGDKALLSRA